MMERQRREGEAERESSNYYPINTRCQIIIRKHTRFPLNHYPTIIRSTPGVHKIIIQTIQHKVFIKPLSNYNPIKSMFHQNFTLADYYQIQHRYATFKIVFHWLSLFCHHQPNQNQAGTSWWNWRDSCRVGRQVNQCISMHLITFIQKGIEIFAGGNTIDERNFGQEWVFLENSVKTL